MPGEIGTFPNTALIKKVKSLIKLNSKCRLVSSNRLAINALITPVRVVRYNGEYKLNFFYQNYSKINSIAIDDIVKLFPPKTGLV